MSETEKAQIRDLTAGIGAVIGGAVGDSSYNAQLAGVIGQNAVENNYLSKKQVNELNTKLNALNNGTKACRDKACVEEINKERNKLIEEYRAISKKQDVELKSLCFSQPNSSACSSGLKEALFYNGSINTPKMQITRNLMKDRNSSSENTLNIIYSSPNAKNLINKRVQSVDDRANFFSTNDHYYNVNNIDIRWFGAAEDVTRAPITGLGADGNLSWTTFGIGYVFTGGPVSPGGTVYEWRDEAGRSLMYGGFDNFRNAFKGNYISPMNWDINQRLCCTNLAWKAYSAI